MVELLIQLLASETKVSKLTRQPDDEYLGKVKLWSVLSEVETE
jgi:hypothetical protein